MSEPKVSGASRKMAEEWREAHPWFRAGHVNPAEFDAELAALLDKRAEMERERIRMIVEDERETEERVWGGGGSILEEERKVFTAILSRIEET